MKFSIGPLGAASAALLLLNPVAAVAQEAGLPPPGAPGFAAPMDAGTPNPQRQAAMQATRVQLERLHQQARTQILAALTPQHRTQFAAIVGEFAIAAAPDPAAAARQLDAMLSPREARSILATAAGARNSARAVMLTARAQFEASLTADERTRLEARMQRMKAMQPNATEPGLDAGAVLLHTALGFARMHGGRPGAP